MKILDMDNLRVQLINLYCDECHFVFPDLETFECHHDNCGDDDDDDISIRSIQNIDEEQQEEEDVVEIDGSSSDSETEEREGSSKLTFQSKSSSRASCFKKSAKEKVTRRESPPRKKPRGDDDTVNNENVAPAEKTIPCSCPCKNVINHETNSTAKVHNPNPTTTTTTTTFSSPGPLDIMSVNFFELQDYLHCCKCFQSFYTLPDLISHFKGCQQQINSTFTQSKRGESQTQEPTRAKGSRDLNDNLDDANSTSTSAAPSLKTRVKKSASKTKAKKRKIKSPDEQPPPPLTTTTTTTATDTTTTTTTATDTTTTTTTAATEKATGVKNVQIDKPSIQVQPDLDPDPPDDNGSNSPLLASSHHDDEEEDEDIFPIQIETVVKNPVCITIDSDSEDEAEDSSSYRQNKSMDNNKENDDGNNTNDFNDEPSFLTIRVPVVKNEDGRFPCQKCKRTFIKIEKLRAHYNSKHSAPQLAYFRPQVNSLPTQRTHIHFTSPNSSPSHTNENNMQVEQVDENSVQVDPDVNDHDSQVVVDVNRGKRKRRRIRKKTDTGDINEPFCFECQRYFVDEKSLGQHRHALHKKNKQKKKKKKKKKKPKNHQCIFCGKCFATSVNWKSHEMSHPENRSYECEICSKRFVVKKTLRMHVRMYHQGEKVEPGQPSAYQEEEEDTNIVE